MNKSEAKELMTKYLLPVIEKYGYRERKIRSSDFSFIRKTPTGTDEIMGRVNLNPAVNKNTATMGFSYCTLNGIKGHVYLPGMQTETDVQSNVAMMVQFLEGTAFPLKELQKIDAKAKLNRFIP